MHNCSHWFKGNLKLNRHAIADASLYAARKIGKGFYFYFPLSFGEGRGEAHENIIMLRSPHFAPCKSGTVFKTMHCINAQHCFAQISMKFIKHRFAEANRAI